MKNTAVRDLMVPLAEYAAVPEEASLFEAVVALEEAQNRFHRGRYPHRAVLVLDPTGRVVGKLSQNDVLRGLEPGYRRLTQWEKTSHWELSREFIKSMLVDYDLWNRPMQDICRKAADIRVRDIMYTPAEGEYVEVDATLDAAIHQLVVGRHQSLLVTEDQAVVGILRLTDVFTEVVAAIKACDI